MKIEKVTDKITLYNCDCMEYMKDIPDKHFDLAIVISKFLLSLHYNFKYLFYDTRFKTITNRKGR